MPIVSRDIYDRAMNSTAMDQSNQILRDFSDHLKGLSESFNRPAQQQPPAAPDVTEQQGTVPSLSDLLRGTGLEHLLGTEGDRAARQHENGPQVRTGVTVAPGGGSFAAPGATGAAPQAAGQPSAPRGPIQPRGAFEEDPGDLESWAVHEAYRLGIDPAYAIKVAGTEGGFKNPTQQNLGGAPAYGPYQLYIGGPQNPGLGDEALRRGIDPRNPRHARAAITFALEHAAQNGWTAFQGAAGAGIGRWDGIRTGATGAQGAARPDGAPQGQQAPADPRVDTTRRRETRGLTPDQIEEGKAAGLDANTAASICGPAAALAFYRANGKLPTEQQAWTLKRAYEEARDNNLWDLDNGMHGPAATVELMRRMGVKGTLDWSVNWDRVRSELQAGRMVVISTPGHYFVAEGLNADGSIDWGNSARILRAAKGRSSFRPEELGSLGMGAPRAAIYMG